jgi:hypothetical protein
MRASSSLSHAKRYARKVELILRQPQRGEYMLCHARTSAPRGSKRIKTIEDHVPAFRVFAKGNLNESSGGLSEGRDVTIHLINQLAPNKSLLHASTDGHPFIW